MMKHSENISNIAAALVKAQTTMEGATKDGKNPAFRSTYATLASVIEAARGPLTANGIAFLQGPGELTENGLKVTTKLVHISGEWIETTLTIALGKRDPQAIGAAITYACRYSLQAMIGLPSVDDDAAAAMPRDVPRKQVPPPDTDTRPLPPPPPEPRLRSVSRTVESIPALLKAIQNTASSNNLDDLINDPGNIELYGRASELDQDDVRNAVQGRRDYFELRNRKPR